YSVLTLSMLFLLSPYTTLFRSDEYYDRQAPADSNFFDLDPQGVEFVFSLNFMGSFLPSQVFAHEMKEGSTIINISSMNAFTSLTDRKSTRLNSSHVSISYAVFC